MKKPAAIFFLLFLLSFLAAPGIDERGDSAVRAEIAKEFSFLDHKVPKTTGFSVPAERKATLCCAGMLSAIRPARKDLKTLRTTTGSKIYVEYFAMNDCFSPYGKSTWGAFSSDPDPLTPRSFRHADYLIFGMLII